MRLGGSNERGLLLGVLAWAAAQTPDSTKSARLSTIAQHIADVVPFGTRVETAQARLEGLGYTCPAGRSASLVVAADTLEGPLCRAAGDSSIMVVLGGYRGVLTRIWVCQGTGVDFDACSWRGDGFYGRGFAPLDSWMIATVVFMTLLAVAAFMRVRRLAAAPLSVPGDIEQILARQSIPERKRRHAVRWNTLRRQGPRRYVLAYGGGWGLMMFFVFGLVNLRDRQTMSELRFFTLQWVTLALCCVGGFLYGWLAWWSSERRFQRVISDQEGVR